MTQREPNEENLSLGRKVGFLQDPARYPEPTPAVETRETHMSWIFLTQNYVYKLKKPVKYPYLDFSTLAKRRQDAEREVVLNRRLAGTTYIGVVVLAVNQAGALQLEGKGRPADYLVKMHRLPEERMLDQLLQNDRVPQDDLAVAARRLAAFYRRAPAEDLGGQTYVDNLRAGLEGDREGLTGLPGIDRELVDQGHALLRTQLNELHKALMSRATQGRVLEGHGDLRPEHICLTAEPVFFDCLEFNRQLRIVDPLDELAYLAVECRRYGHPEAAEVFREIYCRETGDSCPARIFSFYQAKRAFLRASLSAGHLGEEAYDGSREWLDKTHWYLQQVRAAL